MSRLDISLPAVFRNRALIGSSPPMTVAATRNGPRTEGPVRLLMRGLRVFVSVSHRDPGQSGA
jgi:hypothetical protein